MGALEFRKSKHLLLQALKHRNLLLVYMQIQSVSANKEYFGRVAFKVQVLYKTSRNWGRSWWSILTASTPV